MFLFDGLIGSQTLPTLFILLSLSSPISITQKPLIVIVNSYSSTLEWTTDQVQGFKEKLGSDFDYLILDMNTKKHPITQHPAIASNILKIIKKINPNLVYVTDDNAFKWVARYINPKTPIVFSGVNAHLREDYPWFRKSNNITGVLERPLIKRSILESMRALNLAPQKILILLGDSPTAKAYLSYDLKNKRKFKLLNHEVEVKVSGKFENWKSNLTNSTAQGYGLAFMAGAYSLEDKKGNKVDPKQVTQWISKHSPIPVLTTHLSMVGADKLLGGLQLSGIEMGSEAASLSRYILDHNITPKNIIPHTLSASDLKFSQQQIDKWTLSLNKHFKGAVTLIK
jgi:hypothetical protein